MNTVAKCLRFSETGVICKPMPDSISFQGWFDNIEFSVFTRWNSHEIRVTLDYINKEEELPEEKVSSLVKDFL